MATDTETLNLLEAAVARVIAPLAQAQADMARALTDMARAQAETAAAQAETARSLTALDARVLRQGRHAELSFRALTSRMGTVEELLGLLTEQPLPAERLELLEARVRELEAKLAANG